MPRLVITITPLCLFIGCGGPDEQYDLSMPLLQKSVPVPFEGTFNKGCFRIQIKPISGRTDAVEVKAHMHGFYESPSVEWIQEGCSLKKLPLDNGLERYDIEFIEIQASGQIVTKVKLSIVNKVKTGPR
jgi:hypothetical protein